jgi:CHAD domain-containing protein
MAYRLEHDESVIAGLTRVVREEMESAHGQLSGEKKTRRDKAIHESRKHIKKVRALLRLMSGELGDTGKRENARLRDIARRLSDFRDAFAMIATFDDLRETYRKKSAMASIRAGLMKRHRASSRDEDVALVLNEAATALNKASKRVKTWPLQKDGYDAIGPGLRATYRAGRKALARARKNPGAQTYHELRKRVKDHWYHVRLLENLWSDVMTAYEKSLKDLETWLGDDHNLAVLREKVEAEPAFFGSDRDINHLFDMIAGRQKELREESISLAARIYEQKPREFDRRLGHLWETWRREPELPGE